jgi:hypothetical protein
MKGSISSLGWSLIPSPYIPELFIQNNCAFRLLDDYSASFKFFYFEISAKTSPMSFDTIYSS